jgi:hypothetical protein
MACPQLIADEEAKQRVTSIVKIEREPPVGALD